MLLEGIHMTAEAIQSGIAVLTVLYLKEKGIPLELEHILAPETERIAVSAAVLAKCSDTETPQGIVAVAAKPVRAVASLLGVSGALVVVIDGLQDPGNLGTIIRTADAAGASGIVIGQGSVDPYNPKVMRSTMGSLFHLPIIEVALVPLLEQAIAEGAGVYTTGMAATQTCYEVDFTGTTWIVIGNEGKGVSTEVRAVIGNEISIPMIGKAESLNAAMAAGILLFEALRQRGFNNLIPSVPSLK
ncbi:MAG: RNA methyltransferase [Gorillibacterium sp.]|nr:RNA methyltransferase [Gorillibacterium sp.]